MTNLPTPGSVWGIPDQPETWRKVTSAAYNQVVWEKFASEGDEWLPMAAWNEWVADAGAIDIRAMLAESVNQDRLIAWLTDPNRKPPDLAFTSGPEREIADLVVNFAVQYFRDMTAAGAEALATCDASLNEPHTVDWLVAIGGGQFGDGVVFEFAGGHEFTYWLRSNHWTMRGVAIPVPITTKRDVLQWLDVLRIQVKRP
jgi:hypothetical protein